MTTPRLWARCIRGLEEVVADEVLESLHSSAVVVGPRDLEFDSEDLDRAVALRTVDDTFVLAGAVDGVGRARVGLHRLGSETLALPVAETVALQTSRLATRPLSIGVTASFLGKRNFTRFDVENSVGVALSRVLELPYRSRRDAQPAAQQLEWRVHVVDDTARIGLRIADVPLHRRSYKRFAPAGTTHPPLAAAMVRLASLARGGVVWDPTCGAGTIPIEAALAHRTVRSCGSDVDPIKTAGAVDNARAASVNCDFICADATRLPLRDASVSAVIGNLPWGRQTSARSALDAVFALREGRRVLQQNGSVVLVAEDATVGDESDGLNLVTELGLSLMGAHPMLRVWRAT